MITGRATDGTAACDSCLILTLTQCPGSTVHCADGHHCIWQGAECAAENAGYDHPAKCCSCGEPILVKSY